VPKVELRKGVRVSVLGSATDCAGGAGGAVWAEADTEWNAIKARTAANPEPNLTHERIEPPQPSISQGPVNDRTLTV
jgi:hypothetical protein